MQRLHANVVAVKQGAGRNLTFTLCLAHQFKVYGDLETWPAVDRCAHSGAQSLWPARVTASKNAARRTGRRL